MARSDVVCGSLSFHRFATYDAALALSYATFAGVKLCQLIFETIALFCLVLAISQGVWVPFHFLNFKFFPIYARTSVLAVQVRRDMGDCCLFTVVLSVVMYYCKNALRVT